MKMLPMESKRDTKLPPKVELLNRGYKKVREVCAEKWPRLLPVTWAAAYCGFNLPRFRSVPELNACVRIVGGAPIVDKEELDATLDALMASAPVAAREEQSTPKEEE